MIQILPAFLILILFTHLAPFSVETNACSPSPRNSLLSASILTSATVSDIFRVIVIFSDLQGAAVVVLGGGCGVVVGVVGVGGVKTI